MRSYDLVHQVASSRSYGEGKPHSPPKTKKDVSDESNQCAITHTLNFIVVSSYIRHLARRGVVAKTQQYTQQYSTCILSRFNIPKESAVSVVYPY